MKVQLQRPVEDGKQLLSLKDGWVLQRRWQWTWNPRATVAVHLASGAALGQFLDDTQIGADPRCILGEPFCSAPVFWQGWEAWELELLDPLSFMVSEYHSWKVANSVAKWSQKVLGAEAGAFRSFSILVVEHQSFCRSGAQSWQLDSPRQSRRQKDVHRLERHCSKRVDKQLRGNFRVRRKMTAFLFQVTIPIPGWSLNHSNQAMHSPLCMRRSWIEPEGTQITPYR